MVQLLRFLIQFISEGFNINALKNALSNCLKNFYVAFELSLKCNIKLSVILLTYYKQYILGLELLSTDFAYYKECLKLFESFMNCIALSYVHIVYLFSHLSSIIALLYLNMEFQ